MRWYGSLVDHANVVVQGQLDTARKSVAGILATDGTAACDVNMDTTGVLSELQDGDCELGSSLSSL